MTYLTGHNFVHILDTSLRSTKNGELLRIVAPDYDVFLTTDRNIKYQQNLKRFPMAFIIMRPVSNAIEDLLPLLPDTLAILDNIEQSTPTAGVLYEVVPR